MTTVTSWRDQATEDALLQKASIEEPWALVERFAELVRESGTDDERRAFEYISERLSAAGVPHQTFTPTLYISNPREARLEVLDPGAGEVTTKTVSMSASTDGNWEEGTLLHVPAGDGDLFKNLLSTYKSERTDIRDKIVLTEGLAGPGKVAEFQRLGAKAAIFINPGERIHESTCTDIWGTPGLDSWDRRPAIAVLSVNAPDGARLRELAQQGDVSVRFSTRVETDWVECPVCVAEIPGNKAPEEFVLVHGHVDSWHEGIGDNATGDATLLEVARALWEEREHLARTVRVAWWPGHSQGRYAGSTWYADTFSLDIDANCVAHINCDSPGCRWATVYENVFWMSEAADLGRAVIKDATGQDSTGARPLRAGDKSFSNIGVSIFFMLSSTMPQELVEEKGYYPTGGCGGNIAWHTEDDLLEIADRDNLLRDIKVYLLGTFRTANAPIHPLDFTALATELETTLADYEEATRGEFDLSEARHEAQLLAKELDAFYNDLQRLTDGSPADPEVRRANQVLRRLSRTLVPINYTREGKFSHDPAVDVPPLPDLVAAKTWTSHEPNSTERYLTQTQLMRGRNRVTAALRSARGLVAEARG